MLKYTTIPPMMIVFVSALHLFWAIAIWFDVSAASATPPSAIYRTFGSATSYLLLMASIFSALGLIVHRRWVIMFMMPQQLLLTISAIGAVIAIYTSAYADGIVRPRGFIAADQAPIIIMTVAYTISIVKAAALR